MKKIKVTLILSLLFNALFLLAGSAYTIKHGGIGYIKSKITKADTDTNSISTIHYQRNSLFDNLPIGNHDIIFIGDSITQRGEWAELFNNPNVKNRGIDSDTTKDILSRIDKVVSGKPNKIFILAGINDLQRGVKNKELLANYNDIFAKIKNESPSTKVYVQSILPVNTNINKTFIMSNDDIKGLNSELSQATNKFGYTYINLYDAFSNDKNQLTDNLTKDGIHLTGDGYLLWKKEIQQFVDGH